MNLKIVFIGGLVYYIVSFVAGMGTASITHNGILVESYKATAAFWRPELMSEPPNMAALMPLWIGVGLVGSFIAAGIYDVFRSALAGPGWQRGLKFGIALGLLFGTAYFSLFGVFDLPLLIWTVWAIEGLVLTALSGAALGAVAEKLG